LKQCNRTSKERAETSLQCKIVSNAIEAKRSAVFAQIQDIP